MRFRLVCVCALGLVAGFAVFAQQGPPPDGPGGFGRGMGMGMGRGVVGTVTAVASDHYTIRTEAGETWTVHYSVNTRIMKQPANWQPMGQPGGRRAYSGGNRTPPETIKPTDIKVGDVIGANGEVDASGKSVEAMFILQLSPEAVRQMQAMRESFGKTWLAGRVTAINEATVTLHSSVDNADHRFTADENTTFRRHREPVTLADVQVGENVRVEGAVKDGTFVATTVNVMMPPMQGGPVRPHSQEPPR